MDVLLEHTPVYHMHAGALGGRKWMSDPLDLKLQTGVSQHVGAGIRTQVLCKSSRKAPNRRLGWYYKYHFYSACRMQTSGERVRQTDRASALNPPLRFPCLLEINRDDLCSESSPEVMLLSAEDSCCHWT